MKAVMVYKDVIEPMKAKLAQSKTSVFYCLYHGEEGRNRWQICYPLSTKDYPVLVNERGDLQKSFPLNEEVILVDTGKNEPQGNKIYVVKKKTDQLENVIDGKYLVFLYLSPGYRGGAKYEVKGEVQVIGLGYEAQGDAGGMGGAECPVLLITGPCEVTWTRLGRLYGQPDRYTLKFDGENLMSAPQHELDLAELANI